MRAVVSLWEQQKSAVEIRYDVTSILKVGSSLSSSSLSLYI